MVCGVHGKENSRKKNNRRERERDVLMRQKKNFEKKNARNLKGSLRGIRFLKRCKGFVSLLIVNYRPNEIKSTGAF